MVDSKAAFAARCAKIGLPDGVVETLDKKGWGTHATFAFSTAVVPDSGDDSKFVKEVLEPILRSATHEQAANLRRLTSRAVRSRLSISKGRPRHPKTIFQGRRRRLRWRSASGCCRKS